METGALLSPLRIRKPHAYQRSSTYNHPSLSRHIPLCFPIPGGKSHLASGTDHIPIELYELPTKNRVSFRVSGHEGKKKREVASPKRCATVLALPLDVHSTWIMRGLMVELHDEMSLGTAASRRQERHEKGNM